MPEVVNGQPASGVLFLHAQTALHPGSGTALGAVDLPVQRERHTQWPLIPGSSLKGVLRDGCRRRSAAGSLEEADRDPDLTAVFGPPTGQAHEHAGALSVTDARILAFPVRSLRGVFAWTTCPAVLQRLQRDLRLAGRPTFEFSASLEDNMAACPADSPLLLDGKHLVLEEFEFQRAADLDDAAEYIAQHALADRGTQDRLRRHLVVLSDNDFTHFARHATEVAARIGLDYERKTVKDGALFYQEFLPAETIFYSLVFAADSRHRERKKPAADVLAYLGERLEQQSVLQIGGDESTGKGLCVARLYRGKEE